MSQLDEILGQLQAKHQELSKDANPDPNAIMALEERFIQLLNQFPDHPAILFNLGTLFTQTQRPGAGIALLKQSIECGASGSAPWLNIGGAYKVEHKDKSALHAYEKAVVEAQKDDKPGRMNIDLAHAYHGIASLYVNAGQPDKCIHWADKALEIDPEDRFAAWNKGLALLERGDYGAGFDLYDSAGYAKGGLERKLKTYGGLPKWDGTPGETIITYGEQGIGDEVMFASIIPDLLKDCRVIIDCDPRLKTMFERAFPSAEAIYPTSEIDAPFPWVANHKIDAYVPMGSLGMHYRRAKKDFPRTPFLTADECRRAKWRAELAKFEGLKVGISWVGGHKRTRLDMRSIVLPKLMDAMKGAEGVNWFSLQYHNWAADEVAQVGAAIGQPIHHWQDVIADYEETAAFVQELDLVITVNTSLLHLCGALGVPTWCLTPKYVAWRYGCRGQNPWYGSVKMYRQLDAGEWGPVLTRVSGDLRSLLRKTRKEAA